MGKCIICGSDDLESTSVPKWKHGTSAIVHRCLCCDVNWTICDCENCKEKLSEAKMRKLW